MPQRKLRELRKLRNLREYVLALTESTKFIQRVSWKAHRNLRELRKLQN